MMGRHRLTIAEHAHERLLDRVEDLSRRQLTPEQLGQVSACRTRLAAHGRMTETQVRRLKKILGEVTTDPARPQDGLP